MYTKAGERASERASTLFAFDSRYSYQQWRTEKSEKNIKWTKQTRERDKRYTFFECTQVIWPYSLLMCMRVCKTAF